ncbi:hypothetical protein [Actinomadura miaoliensis]|uniref:Uncharacterized protein n=1 Tax=Actinomadura miaoliensis TaxID=430685 RepID=A0ABP7UXS8_9ACTN
MSADGDSTQVSPQPRRRPSPFTETTASGHTTPCRTRVADAWRRGWAHYWLDSTAEWLAWVQQEDPEGQPWPWFGSFAYWPESIARRESEQPPG